MGKLTIILLLALCAFQAFAEMDQVQDLEHKGGHHHHDHHHDDHHHGHHHHHGHDHHHDDHHHDDHHHGHHEHDHKHGEEHHHEHHEHGHHEHGHHEHEHKHPEHHGHHDHHHGHDHHHHDEHHHGHHDHDHHHDNHHHNHHEHKHADLYSAGYKSDTISDIIAKIKQIIAQMTDELKAAVQKIEDQIKQAISNVDIDKIIDEIKSKLEQELNDILKKAGINPANVQDCIKTAAAAIKALAEEVKEGIMKCKSGFDTATADVTKKMNAIVSEAIAVDEDVEKRVLDCVKNNVDKPAQMVSCLANENTQIVAEVKDLKSKIDAIKQEAVKVIVASEGDMRQCIKQVIQDAIPKGKAIADQFRQCIKSETTTTAA